MIVAGCPILRWREEWDIGIRRLDEFEQEKDDDDGEDEADTAAAVVAEAWSHAITTEAEHKNQNDQKDKHCFISPFGEDSPYEGVMRVLLRARENWVLSGVA
jgi:hypothetical protein